MKRRASAMASPQRARLVVSLRVVTLPLSRMIISIDGVASQGNRT